MTGRRSRLERSRILVDESGDVWFFAYGSLMWDPGFAPVEMRPALLHGWHRAFCVRSVRYRGTPCAPGLVLGLDRGGSCRGRALLVAEADRERVFGYLEEREMPEEIYSCRRLAMTTPEGRIRGYGLVVNRDNALYDGGRSPQEMARRIARSTGERGPNRDYLANTVRHLDEFGIGDGPMHALLAMVETIAAKDAKTGRRGAPARR
jgi:cation transport protein ChaC